ncbi:hypothetical protein C2845_PM04G00120 [Panicum miliaceum]|uniref:F-box/LRR-repeat protein 15/At3g58940/PEG3-like LRR domain-containing protein n=1 Tax=Panicum miliaceum TaxID=4540 RepID=A0A3L6QNL1_PANMI|nr:hypothetical protein C2845_PM04G00120 [Panicum miliaceum]
MEPNLSGGQLAAKLSEDDAGVDRLSALPNDVLLRILLRLEDAAAAGRTSVLASRWRRLWARLPELRFPFSPELRAIGSALAAHEAAISRLDVGAESAAPESVAAWLLVAARRLSGSLVFTNRVPAGKDANNEAGEKRGAFELPCLENATTVSLDLGGLGVAVPPAGVFARLTELSLSHVQFRGPCALGDALSSRRCPCLEKLTVHDTLGLNNITIDSNSLRHMELANMRGLQQLTIVVPALEHLKVLACFFRNRNRPVANISARQLKVLKWGDLFDRSSVKLGRMKHLESLCTDLFLVYGSSPNHSCLALLRCFKIIQELHLMLVYLPDINDEAYLLEDMKMLPGVMCLNLSVVSNGHAFGTSLFHVLRLCSGCRKLSLELSRKGLEEQSTCPPGCICDELQNWKTEELLLNHLQEVEITEFSGSEHEVTFVKLLFKWATEVLTKITVSFNSLMTESMAKKMYKILRSFSRPEICMEFFMSKDMVKVLYVPED